MASTATTTKASYNIYNKVRGRLKPSPSFSKNFRLRRKCLARAKKRSSIFIYHFPIFIAIFVVKFIIKFAIYKKYPYLCTVLI